MLGQPVYFLTPDVVGVELTGKLPRRRDGDRPRADRHRDAAQGEGRRQVRRVLRRRHGVAVGARPRDDRQHGARIRRDDGLLPGRRRDGRLSARDRPHRRGSSTRSKRTSRRRACSAFRAPARSTTRRSLTLDLASRHAVASPDRSARRTASSCRSSKTRFTALFSKPVSENGFSQPAERLRERYKTLPMIAGRGAVSDAAQQVPRNGDAARLRRDGEQSPDGRSHRAAGAQARRHRQRRRPDRRDHVVHEHVEPERAARRRPAREEGGREGPDGQAAHQDVARARLARRHRLPDEDGLLPYLEQLGFDVAAYGCTTCIGNAGDLTPEINDAIASNDLVCAAVLSGNRNFEARIHPNLKANFLMSPPLVVAYAIAGTVLRDLATEPLGKGSDGTGVPARHLADVARDRGAARATRAIRTRSAASTAISPTRTRCGTTIAGVDGPGLRLADVDLHREAAVLRRLQHDARRDRRHPRRARARHLRRFGHDRPHLAGRLDQADVARGHVPAGKGRVGRELQQLRLAPRQSRGDDARHVRATCGSRT